MALDTLRPTHRILDNDNILSNRFNAALKDLRLAEVYARIQGVTDITGLSALLNYVEGDSTVQYDGYHDSKFYKVKLDSAPRKA